MSEYSFREHDCLVRVDRSQQLLNVEVKDGSWGVRWYLEQELQRREQESAASEETDAHQIIGIGCGETFVHVPFSTMAEGMRTAEGATVPLMAFVQKAKLFDDWLYATLDTAEFLGDGPALGKKALVRYLRLHLSSISSSADATALLCAAEQLGSGKAIADLSVILQLKIKQRLNAFHADSKQSRPIGVYSESDLLRRIFQHDRMVQHGLSSKDAQTLATAIAHLNLMEAYNWHLQCSQTLTGPFALPSVLESLQQEPTPDNKYALFPASKAPETDLMKRLYGDRPIPDDFCVIDELIAHVRDGSLDLTPSDEDGWYLRQLYALEALLSPDNERLKVGPKYAQCLEKLFKGLMSLSRETHVKQLEGPRAGGIPAFIIAPHLRLEPIPSYYKRRADSYRWVLRQLIALWGESRLTRQVRDRHNRPTCILDALTDMESLFIGAAHLCWQDLGLRQVPLDTSQRQAVSFARKFVSNWLEDPDMQVDCRMMVPLYYDEERQRTHVSVVCGFLSDDVGVQFDQRPDVQVTDAFGQPAEASVTWQDSSYVTVYPMQFECDVKEVCDRDTLRQLADQYPNPRELKQVLEG